MFGSRMYHMFSTIPENFLTYSREKMVKICHMFSTVGENDRFKPILCSLLMVKMYIKFGPIICPPLKTWHMFSAVGGYVWNKIVWHIWTCHMFSTQQKTFDIFSVENIWWKIMSYVLRCWGECITSLNLSHVLLYSGEHVIGQNLSYLPNCCGEHLRGQILSNVLHSAKNI